MKFTGLVRRIDTLGRVVIPKEIRDYLAIKTDDCLDISVEKDNQEREELKKLKRVNHLF